MLLLSSPFDQSPGEYSGVKICWRPGEWAPISLMAQEICHFVGRELDWDLLPDQSSMTVTSSVEVDRLAHQ